MSTNKDRADQLIDEVTILQPSMDWPPVLNDNEVAKFEGGFNRDIWLRKNVGFTLIAFAIIAIIAYVANSPISAQGMAFVGILSLIGGAITYAMYSRQRWLITDRAVYVNRGRPMLISSARKIAGFGSTVRLTGRWGVGITLLGVTNAAEIRATLQGRAT